MQVEENCVLNVFKEDNEPCDCQKEDGLYPNVKKALNALIKTEGYKTFKVTVRSLEPDGGNYLAKLYVVDIVGRTAKGYKETNIFIKQALPTNVVPNFISIDNAYLKEVFFYTELCALYKKLQTDAGIETNEMLKSVKCYDGSSAEAIFLENQKKNGFDVLFRMDVMPLRFAQLAMEQLAKFHALSFVLEKRMPEYFNQKKAVLKPPLQYDEDFQNFASNVVELATVKFDKDVRDKIREDFPIYFSRYSKYVTDTASSVNSFCHGDFRSSNILMKEIDGEVTEVIPIDYQLLFYGSPITDLLYFLYNGSDAKFRRAHENDLKDHYYMHLERFLRNFEIDVETVFPRKIFEDDYERMRDFGLYISLMILPYIFSQENVPDCESGKATLMNLQIDNKYYPRIFEIYSELNHLV